MYRLTAIAAVRLRFVRAHMGRARCALGRVGRGRNATVSGSTGSRSDEGTASTMCQAGRWPFFRVGSYHCRGRHDYRYSKEGPAAHDQPAHPLDRQAEVNRGGAQSAAAFGAWWGGRLIWNRHSRLTLKGFFAGDCPGRSALDCGPQARQVVVGKGLGGRRKHCFFDHGPSAALTGGGGRLIWTKSGSWAMLQEVVCGRQPG